MKAKFFLTAFIFLTLQLHAQVTFQKYYGVPAGSVYAVNEIVNTPGGGYAFIGSSVANVDLDEPVLIKVNANGDTAFTRYYGGPREDFATALALASDSGFFIGGFTWGFVTQEIDNYFIRTNKYGDTLWTRLNSHASGGVEYCKKVAKTNDNNFVAFGGQSTFSGNFFLTKWGNTTGNVIWSKSYGGNQHDWGFDMQPTADDGFIMIGWCSSFAGTDTNLFVVKADSMGSLQWAKSYGGSSIDKGYAVKQTPDGGYLFAGTTSSFGLSTDKIYLIRTNATGDTLWTKKYNANIDTWGSWNNKYIFMELTPDNGFALCYTTYVNGGDVSILKADSAGSIQWLKHYGTSGSETAHALVMAPDGGFLASAYTSSTPDMLVIKTDANGNSGCNQLTDTTSWSYTNTIVTSPVTTVLNYGIVKGTGTVMASGMTVTTSCFSTGVTEAAFTTPVSIYPNPAATVLNIQLNQNSAGINQLFVYDAMGKLVLTNSFSGSMCKLNTENLLNGFYAAKLISGDNQNTSFKFTVNRF